MTGPRITVLDDTEALANVAARMVADAARCPVTVSLSGGSTPKAAYQRLAGLAVPWSNLRLFFGDERCVPPTDEDSNYRMVKRALLVERDAKLQNHYRWLQISLETTIRDRPKYGNASRPARRAHPRSFGHDPGLLRQIRPLLHLGLDEAGGLARRQR